MTKTVSVFVLFSLSITGCNNDNTDRQSLHGTWTVLSFENLATHSTEFRTQENSWNRDIKVTFDDSTNPKTLSGTNISNQIFGEFSYVGPQQLKITKLGSTLVYQPRWANEFIRILADGDLPYTIVFSRLVIYYDNNSRSVTLARN